MPGTGLAPGRGGRKALLAVTGRRLACCELAGSDAGPDLGKVIG